MQPLPKVNCKYGAPIGRCSDQSDPDFRGTVVCEPILDPCPNACGAYDYEGAYWGVGDMVWRCECVEGAGMWTLYRRSGDIEADMRKEMPFAAAIEVLERPVGEHCGADWGEEPCEWCMECEVEEPAE